MVHFWKCVCVIIPRLHQAKLMWDCLWFVCNRYNWHFSTNNNWYAFFLKESVQCVFLYYSRIQLHRTVAVFSLNKGNIESYTLRCLPCKLSASTKTAWNMFRTVPFHLIVKIHASGTGCNVNCVTWMWEVLGSNPGRAPHNAILMCCYNPGFKSRTSPHNAILMCWYNPGFKSRTSPP